MVCLERMKKDLGLDSATLDKFVEFQFGQTRYMYPLWCSLWLLFHLAWVIVEIYWWGTEDVTSELWPVYLTNWGYVVLLLYLMTDFVISIYVRFIRNTRVEINWSMTWYSKTQWVLLNVNNATSVIITLAYWTLIASNTHATSINKHGLNSVYAIINIFITAKPINITHMWHPVLLSLIYVVFSVIYQLGFGVPPIYIVLDWSKPTTALLTSVPLVFIGVPLCHVMFFILYRTRCVIFRKCCLKKDKAKQVPVTQTYRMNRHDGIQK